MGVNIVSGLSQRIADPLDKKAYPFWLMLVT